ncbi:MAG: helix-turn-helix domain-containing protein [Planctomycetota bacterium]
MAVATAGTCHLLSLVGARRADAPRDLSSALREIATYDGSADVLGYGYSPDACLSQCPSAAACLLCIDTVDAAGGDRQTHVWLVGPHHRPFAIGTPARRVLRGVSLPLWADALVGLCDARGGELVDTAVDLARAGGNETRVLCERLVAAADNRIRRILLLEHLRTVLGRRRSRRPWSFGVVDEAMRWLEQRGGRADLAGLQRHLGLSPRQTRRCFTAASGWSPKTYACLLRLAGALEAATRSAALDWSHLSQLHGYCDQSHLVRECRRFLGAPPVALLARQANRYALGVGHLHVQGDNPIGAVVTAGGRSTPQPMGGQGALSA